VGEVRDGRPARPGRPRRPTPAERREERSRSADPAEALDAAARLLEARPRSEDEVRRRLLRLGYQPGLVDGAVARLLALGYLDDAAFARSWVESRDRARPRGEHALRRELAQKGLDASLVAEVLAERRDAVAAGAPDAPGADEAAAERLLARRLGPILREPDPRRRLGRAYALLARGGFAPDVCSAVARRALSAADGDAGQADDPATEGG